VPLVDASSEQQGITIPAWRPQGYFARANEDWLALVFTTWEGARIPWPRGDERGEPSSDDDIVMIFDARSKEFREPHQRYAWPNEAPSSHAILDAEIFGDCLWLLIGGASAESNQLFYRHLKPSSEWQEFAFAEDSIVRMRSIEDCLLAESQESLIYRIERKQTTQEFHADSQRTFSSTSTGVNGTIPLELVDVVDDEVYSFDFGCVLRKWDHALGSWQSLSRKDDQATRDRAMQRGFVGPSGLGVLIRNDSVVPLDDDGTRISLRDGSLSQLKEETHTSYLPKAQHLIVRNDSWIAVLGVTGFARQDEDLEAVVVILSLNESLVLTKRQERFAVPQDPFTKLQDYEQSTTLVHAGDSLLVIALAR